MGATYELVNVTKKERILFLKLPVDKAKEIAGNEISAAITTWYLLQNQGDEIGFVSDYDESWPMKGGRWDELAGYTEVTGKVIQSLIDEGILTDHGSTFIDDDPELELRNLELTWSKT